MSIYYFLAFLCQESWYSLIGPMFRVSLDYSQGVVYTPFSSGGLTGEDWKNLLPDSLRLATGFIFFQV